MDDLQHLKVNRNEIFDILRRIDQEFFVDRSLGHVLEHEFRIGEDRLEFRLQGIQAVRRCVRGENHIQPGIIIPRFQDIAFLRLLLRRIHDFLQLSNHIVHDLRIDAVHDSRFE